MSETHSVFEYLYRDASNYKAYGSILLRGLASADDLANIESKVSDDGLFVPELVGLKPLQSHLEGFPSGDDHIWHECLELRVALPGEVGDCECWGNLATLVENFLALPEWTSLEMHSRIGLLLRQEPYSLMR